MIAWIQGTSVNHAGSTLNVSRLWEAVIRPMLMAYGLFGRGQTFPVKCEIDL